MDVLSDIVRRTGLTGSSYFCTDFSAPWGLDIDEQSRGLFHLVVRGEGLLYLKGDPVPVKVTAGDIIAFPRGQSHRLVSAENAGTLPGSETVERIITGDNPFAGSSTHTTLLCGYFEYGGHVARSMLSNLPDFLHIKANSVMALREFSGVVELLIRETRQAGPGSQVLIDRLTEVLFVQLLRCALEDVDEGVLKALADRRLSRALQAIHDNPANTWTVEGLGRVVGMSRTGFNEHFRKVLGMTPLTYLTQWRMLLTKDQLENTDDGLMLIAERVGYQSEASLSKTFKKNVGINPSEFRRNARAMREGAA